MRLVLVYNPKSGSSLAREKLVRLFADHAVDLTALIEVGDGFESKLKKYIKDGAHIAVVGGDGTLSAVAGLVAGTKATLVPLPGGTLNHFTKDLEVPQNLTDAIAALARARIVKVDIASVNGAVFLNNSSIGLYSSTLHTRSKFESIIGKWPAAIFASIRAMLKLRGYTVLIQDKIFRTPFVFVGNNEYKLDRVGAPVRTRVDKGMLSLFIAKKVSRLALVKIVALSLVGKARESGDFDVRSVKAVTIKSRRGTLSVSHDGEVSRMQTPLHYEIRSRALRVLC